MSVLTKDQRDRILDVAAQWERTPFHDDANLKGIGVDCAMILVRVFCDLGLVPPFDPRPYVKDWMMHRDDERYLGFLLARARETSEPRPGDVVLFRVGRCFAHGGIVTGADPLTLVHAYAPARCVVEERLAGHPDLGQRARKFFAVA